MKADDLRSLIRTVPDFPVPGIRFRDITTLLADGAGFSATVERNADRANDARSQAIAGMEARGFIFGAAVAFRLRLPFIPIRKPGKLPVPTIGVDYNLEYGTDRLELDPVCIPQSYRVAIVDDLVATGGTTEAAVRLLRKAGATVDTALFVIGLPDLGGMARFGELDLDVATLVDYAGT